MPQTGDWAVDQLVGGLTGGVANTVGAGSTTASGVYVQPTNLCGFSFTAPASGIVFVFWATQLANDDINGLSRSSPSLRLGSTIGAGTVVVAPDDVRCILHSQPGIISKAHRSGCFVPYPNLTPGNDYNVTIEFRASGLGNTTMSNQICGVLPIF